MLDRRLVTALHVEALRHNDLAEEHEPHVLFQASTIGALLDGAYDGDVTFAELTEHGDLGLGTLNGLDGEMIALDGRFYRADIEGQVNEIDPDARTPFAVMVWFQPAIDFESAGPLDDAAFRRLLDERAPGDATAWALRVDGEFELVRARSVPRQAPPYRPLSEVIPEQRIFELEDTAGTLIGFRFPDFAEGLEVSGYHLHFISDDRVRGGHVLSCRPRRVRVRIDPSEDLHVELPPGVDLAGTELVQSTREALRRAEHSNE
jgi:acetolactate decarboxylase